MTVEEAYKNYTETIFIETDKTLTSISPRGHYTRETIDDFKNKLLTDDFFNKEWGNGCTIELTLEERYELVLPIWKKKYGEFLAKMMVKTNVDNTPYKVQKRKII